MDRNAKINMIADIQKEFNKRIKKWCEAESSFIEKHSFMHDKTDTFIDKDGKKFTVNKTVHRYNNFLRTPCSPVLIIVDSLLNLIQQEYAAYAKSISDNEEFAKTLKPIKFVCYGLHYVDENTVELQYGFSNIIDTEGNVYF